MSKPALRVRHWVRPAGVALLALLAAALLWRVLPAPAALWQRAAALPAHTWLLAAAGLALSYALRAARLRDEWVRRVPASWREGLHITLLHSAAVNVLPMRAGELGYPWLLYHRWGVAPADSAASLFWLRAQDAVVLGAWAFVVFGPTPAGTDATAALAVRSAAALLLLLLLAATGPALAAAAQRALRNRGNSDTGAGSWPLRLARRLTTAAQHAHARGWGWAAANWTVKLAVLALLLQALGGLQALPASAAALAGEVAAVLPLQPPSGFGTYEAGVWLGARVAGVPAAQNAAVLGAAFTVHLFVLLCSVLAALLSWSLDGLLRPERSKA